MGRGLPLRIVFAGTSGFAVPALRALAAGPFPPSAVLTRPARPAGRGQQKQPSAVQSAATELGLSVLDPPAVNADDAVRELAALQPDLMVVASYGQILKRPLLEMPHRGCVNLHASLLPAWRGAAPVAHALLAGDRQTGVTLMHMDEGLDTGPMYAAMRTPVTASDDRGRLTRRLARMAALLLMRHLEALLAGALVPVPQDSSRASHAPMLKKADGALDWLRPAAELARRIQAFNPRPGAFCFADGRRMLVRRAVAAPGPRVDGKPGTVGSPVGGEAVPVRCGEETCLHLLEVQPEGRARMTAAAALRGRRLQTGQVLASAPAN